MKARDSTHRESGGKQIPGVRLRAYIHNGPYHLVELRVFKDGMVDCWELVTFARFKQKVEEGWVVTALPEGAQVSIFPLGSFKATEVKSGVRESELIREVADVIEELNGRPVAADRCIAALKAYKETPSEQNRELLREAYEAIPAHNRRFVLGDQDRQDLPIRMILSGEQEVEEWSHRQAGAASGMNPPPGIDVPEVLEEIFPSPKKRLSGSLQMALHALYQHTGIGQPIFPVEARDQVEALFRAGDEVAGVRRVLADIDEVSNRHGRRPTIVTRLSGALTSLGEYLEESGRTEAAITVHLQSVELNPDGLSATLLARLAVKSDDVELARRLGRMMAEFGLEPVPDESLAAAFGLDAPAFRKLLE